MGKIRLLAIPGGIGTYGRPSSYTVITSLLLVILLSCTPESNNSRVDALVSARRLAFHQNKVHTIAAQIKEYIHLISIDQTSSGRHLEKLIDAIVSYHPFTTEDRTPVYYAITKLFEGIQGASLNDDDITKWFELNPNRTNSPQANFLLEIMKDTAVMDFVVQPPERVFDELRSRFPGIE